MARANDIGADGAVALARPERQLLPVVASSPHSGRRYDPAFMAMCRLDAEAIRRSEDAFVDRMLEGMAGLGIASVHALFPRAYLDANREPWELDPDMFEGALPRRANGRSARVRSGLGTVPKVVAGGAVIHRGKLPVAEAERRIRQCYIPYHDALVDLVASTLQTFGAACLIDCHSMPSTGNDGGPNTVDAVVGDRFGAACDRAVTAAAIGALRDRGLAVRRNDPYPGGFITEHYGRPDEGRHAIQIEINRRLYMEERTMRPGEGLAAMRAALEAVALAVGDVVLALSAPASAAE